MSSKCSSGGENLLLCFLKTISVTLQCIGRSSNCMFVRFLSLSAHPSSYLPCRTARCSVRPSPAPPPSAQRARRRPTWRALAARSASVSRAVPFTSPQSFKPRHTSLWAQEIKQNKLVHENKKNLNASTCHFFLEPKLRARLPILPTSTQLSVRLGSCC